MAGVSMRHSIFIHFTVICPRMDGEHEHFCDHTLLKFRTPVYATRTQLEIIPSEVLAHRVNAMIQSGSNIGLHIFVPSTQ